MTRLFTVIALLGVALMSAPATAQFVKGNEAVSAGKVTTPAPPSSVGKVCRADGGCHAGSWRMVETPAGLMECTEPWARDGSCRHSTYGAQKLPRVWVVKRGGEWVQCQFPELGSTCVSMAARPPANLPVDAVQ